MPPAVLYRISAKGTPVEIVNEVIARAVSGEIVGVAEVIRTFRESENLEGRSRRASLKDQRAAEMAKENAREIIKRFGRDGAAFILGIEEIGATLSCLNQELGNTGGTV